MHPLILPRVPPTYAPEPPPTAAEEERPGHQRCGIDSAEEDEGGCSGRPSPPPSVPLPPSAAPPPAPPLECIKRMFQPSVKKRKRSHGFLHRLRGAGGRRVLGVRRAKGRWRLAV